MFIMGSSRQWMSPDGTLVIRNTVKKDAGVYGCLASNVAGTQSQTSALTYIESPQVTVLQSELLVGLGEMALMECTATGIPQPEFHWYKGDSELHASGLVDVDPERGAL
ncbi:hypothetical protein AALO_G00130080 [Alosa alosa]|uniref:Ig-like domain-containing protein n=1 Tax=Alosa alosa TaxID=278164 RepID=A0AAV6GSB3_9TELE|nr:hypothetical protein AALO_G00130080 [Alosa alosa]